MWRMGGRDSRSSRHGEQWDRTRRDGNGGEVR